ncbi:MAG: redox-sensing transcriptional repressor Rex, partial [Clostridia bacterium]|nr:redox-sensing transcriptional repressor Rex [Clostridia bacterium]
LNCFGGFGQQGYGYNVQLLHGEISSILGLDIAKTAILIGMGNLGKAVTMHMNFDNKGFRIIGLFDSKPSLVGQVVRNLPIRNAEDLDEFCRENRPEVAILCIPKEVAKDISKQLINLGVKAFWNFSHYDLKLENQDVIVENVHLSESLMRLSYRMKNNT